MTHRALCAALLLYGLLTLDAPSAWAAPGDRVVGLWQAMAMEMNGKRRPVKPPLRITFEYRRGGKFIVVMSYGKNSKRQDGTWSATANRLTMTVKGKKEVTPYKIRGRTLTFTKVQAGKKATFTMKRVR